MIECDFFGSDATLHHVGMAVESIKNLQPNCEVITEERQRVYAAFIRVGGIRIELLEPFDEASPIARSLREGVKLLHLCYEVADIGASLKCCKGVGLHVLSAPIETPMYDNRLVAWVFSKPYGLFELLEREKADIDTEPQIAGVAET